MKKKIDKIDVIMPRLVESINGWYIEYSCYYEKNNKLEKFREYKGFSKINGIGEKRKFGKKRIQVLSTKLKAGWRPWSPTEYIYRDETQYNAFTKGFGNKTHNNSHIHKHLSDFLIITKRRVSPKTYESYQSKTRVFTQWLDENNYGKLRVFEISEKIVTNFFNYLIDTRKLDRLTIEKYKQNIDQLFKYCIKVKLIDRMPTGNIVYPPKLKDNAARPISDADIQKLLTYMAKNDPQMLLASLMQFFLCCRPGNELRLLQIQDIDLFNNIIHVTQANGKTGKRKITMPEALVELCNDYKLNNYPPEYYVFSQNGKPGIKALGKNHFTRHFAKYRDNLKLPKMYKFYSFKHTGAGKLLESGATIIEVKSHLGHSSIESTLAYVRRHFGDKSEKILSFNPQILKGII
jgi:integrase